MLHQPDWEFSQYFDGGETGCGEILVDLMLFFRPLPAGTRVLIIARDAGAPLEMPAWCRSTGHHLLSAEHPYYLVESK
jgi:tRNA 2-thiouridine synthesizing protein A